MPALEVAVVNNSSRRKLFLFIGIGLINTIVDVGIFLALREAHVPILIANILSTTVALGLSYLLNSRFTFQSTSQASRSLPLFLLVTLAGLWLLQPVIIKIVLLLLATQVFDGAIAVITSQPTSFYELIAKLAATPATLIWNYVLYKNVVFKHK